MKAAFMKRFFLWIVNFLLLEIDTVTFNKDMRLLQYQSSIKFFNHEKNNLIIECFTHLSNTS